MIFAPFSFRQQSQFEVPSGYNFYYDIESSETYPGTGTTLFDLSANNYDATLTNGPVYDSVSPKNFDFDGIDDFGNVSNSASFGNDTDSFTIGGWFKFNSGTANNIISRGRDGSGDGWSMFVGSNTYSGNKRAVFTLIASGSPIQYQQIEVSGSTNLSNDTWYNVMGTWEAGIGAKVYLNGVSENTVTNTRTKVRPSTVYWDIGRLNNSYYDQDIAKIITYTRKLTDQEIKQFFDATKSIYGY